MRVRTTPFIAAALVAPLITTAPAAAAGLCKGRSEIVTALLSETLGRQQQRWFGLQADRSVLEIFCNAEGRWTAVRSMPNGTSCVVMEGEGCTLLKSAPWGDPA